MSRLPSRITPWSIALWLALAEIRQHPWRVAIALLAIALGVALAVAVHHINRSALQEFGAALRTLNGEADLIIQAPGLGMDERVFDEIAALDAIDEASPVVRLELSEPRTTVLGLDALRAGRITPALLGRVTHPNPPRFARFVPGAFVSPALLDTLENPTEIELLGPAGPLRYPIWGVLDDVTQGQRLVVLDIAVLQQDFAWQGRLSGLDLRLAAGSDPGRVRMQLQAILPAGAQVLTSDELGERQSNLSRAYRVNLNVLALVALFTGGFLLFANQSLSVVRRRAALALLRVLGLRATLLQRWILVEGAALGTLGGMCGIGLGLALAAAMLHWVGADLGSGYFSGQSARLSPDALALSSLLLISAALGALASTLPAREAAQADPAQALKAGAHETLLRGSTPKRVGLSLLALALPLLSLPSIGGIPIAAYLAMVCILLGTISLMPWLTQACTKAVAGAWPWKSSLTLLPGLALSRLAAVPGQASIASAGIVASLSLMVAMAVMVGSFRDSVVQWLDRVLPADLYVYNAVNRLEPLHPDDLVALTGLGLDLKQSRITELAISSTHTPVALIARPISLGQAAQVLPITGELQLAPPPTGVTPVWVSEAMERVHGWTVGSLRVLPIGTHSLSVQVQGVWRDYARQTGAIILDLETYQELTGDTGITDVALVLPPQADLTHWQTQLREALPVPERVRLSSAREIRSLSLAIFDRSFAITYLLEAVAVIVGLFGIATTFAGQVLAREREFAMLRHVGMTRRQLQTLLAFEGGLVTALGVGVGTLCGLGLSAILVYWVNPQSFHWTMDLTVPWWLVVPILALVFVAGTVTAAVSARAATRGDILRGVRHEV